MSLLECVCAERVWMVINVMFVDKPTTTSHLVVAVLADALKKALLVWIAAT
jgi:hypothetical protein